MKNGTNSYARYVLHDYISLRLVYKGIYFVLLKQKHAVKQIKWDIHVLFHTNFFFEATQFLK